MASATIPVLVPPAGLLERTKKAHTLASNATLVITLVLSTAISKSRPSGQIQELTEIFNSTWDQLTNGYMVPVSNGDYFTWVGSLSDCHDISK